MIDFIIINLSLVVIIATGIILYELRPIIGSDRRMDGFFALSVTVLAWVAAAIVNMFAAPEFYAYTYIINVMFSIIVPYLIFRFFLSFTESKLADSRVMKTMLTALPAVDILMLLSTPYHGLYFRSLDPPVYPDTIPSAGIMFWIHIALIAAGILFFYTILIRYIIKNFKNSPLLIITGVGAVIPFILNIAYVINLFGFDRDLSPIGFFLTIFLFAFYTHRSHVRTFDPDMFRDAMLKSLYMSKMSHAIRTPMNAIIGMTGLAMREEISSSVRNKLLIVKQESASLLSILTDICDISQTDASDMQINPSEYLLSSIVNDVTNIIKMKAYDSKLRFTVYIDSNIPGALVGDESRIRQVLVNLLCCAVKHTDQGYIALSITGEVSGESDIGLIIEIRASCKGINKEVIESLFNNTFKLDAQSGKALEGVELGLVISLSVIKSMGGDINVESADEKDSLITVKLPQKIYKPDKLAVVKAASEKSVLIFERRAVYVESLIKTLNNLGVAYELVSDTKELRKLAVEKTFSCIFISYNLFENNMEAIIEISGKSNLILLTEFGESVASDDLNTIAMPVHAISIAGILNNKYYDSELEDGVEKTVKFIAPDAKVLVVDDINTNLRVARGLLIPYKMNVDVRCSGIEAIEAVRNNKYDLILMDHKMPDMDGVETTERIRAMGNIDIYFETVPIIAYTANADSSLIDMFLNSGFSDFMAKPIETVRLNMILEKWIPKDKQTSIEEETGASRVTESRISIEGLDVDRGIALSGGTEKYYLETLAAFIDDVQERRNEIVQCLKDNNLPLYITHIHALKSASASIGAESLSEAAYALEMAAIRKDLHFISKNNNFFMMKIERILNSIINALMTYGRDGKEMNVEIDTGLFGAELLSLKAALEYLDIDGINQSIDTLLRTAQSEDVLAVVRNISKCILMVEYDEAEALIMSLLGKLKIQ